MDFILACTLFLRIIAYTAGFYYPSFDIRIGQTLDTTQSYFIETVPSLCNCRQLCYEDEQCIAFRANPHSYRWKCFLFEYGLTYKLLNDTCLTGQLGVKIVPGSQLGADGLYYYIYPTPLNYTMAKLACQKGIGYRFALIKTVASFNIAAAYSNNIIPPYYLVVDLVKNPGGLPIFGDGTPYQQTEIGNQTPPINLVQNNPSYGQCFFFVWSGGFDDTWTYAESSALCQGNPLKL